MKKRKDYIMRKKKILLFVVLMLMGAFLLSGMAVLASSDDYDTELETLSVDDYNITGDTLIVTIRDKNTGASHIIELSLSEHVDTRDELIILQATDAHGNVSNTVQFRNPLFSPDTTTPQSGTATDHITTGNPLTPDGTGEVVDNATEDDGKEFFSITTENGNIFYLIVDRQRNIDNVYLLSSVTERDLMALAEPGDGNTSAIPPMPVEPPEPDNAFEPLPLPEPEPESESSGTLILIIIVIAAIVGAAYYFKIVKPKKDVFDDDFGNEHEEFNKEHSDESESFEANTDDPNQD